MEPFFYNVLFYGVTWIIGAFLGDLVYMKFIKKHVEDDGEISGQISTDDIVDYDKDERAYIPVKILRKAGLYYGWFSGNDKFIGQAETVSEIHLMTRDHILKQLGLRLEFKEENE
jgi:hypothetical protein